MVGSILGSPHLGKRPNLKGGCSFCSCRHIGWRLVLMIAVCNFPSTNIVPLQGPLSLQKTHMGFQVSLRDVQGSAF